VSKTPHFLKEILKNPIPKIWLVIILGTVSFTCFQTGSKVLKDLFDRRVSVFDGPSIWAERMLVVEKSLPPNERSFGYLSEGEIPGLNYDQIDHDEELVMTQYFLSPRILNLGADEKYILVNLPNADLTRQQLEEKFNIRLLKNIGWGLSLYERRSP
jgi:hypothetical protein